MRKILKTYFEVSRSEFNGLLALTVLIAIMTAIPRLYHLALPRSLNQRNSKNIHVPVEGKSARNHLIVERRSYTKYHAKLFVFDPNTADIDVWQRLGLSMRQAVAILNYRAKGGKFRKGEDLKKMYTISTEMYERLLPYVRISGKEDESSMQWRSDRSAKPYPMKPVNIVEVNSADSAKLTEIKGIGPVFARRILRLRERVGGFHRKEQLLEVFGMDSVKLAEISGQVVVDTFALRKINVNAVEIEDLKGNPYITYKQANALIQYRKQHGQYRNIVDLRKVLILDAETVRRLSPYINFQ